MVGWSNNSLAAHSIRILIALMSTVIIGCGEDMSIRQYTVDKSEAKRSPLSASAAVTEQQMLAAIVPNRDSTWFFKLTGTPADVSATESQFREIVNSIKFAESGDPSWELSTGWTEQRTAGGITYANLEEKQRGLKATVTQLTSPKAASDDDWELWVRDNVNRWRESLALDKLEWNALKPDLEELESLNQGQARAYYVSLRGKGGGKMGGPFSGGPVSGGPVSGGPFSGGPMNAPNMPSMGTSSNVPELTYAVPPGWEQGPPKSMRIATFNIAEDDLRAEVTLSDAGGDDRSNVQRWQGQLTPTADQSVVDSVIQSAERFEVNSSPAELYSMKGAEGPDQEVILAVKVAWQPNSNLYVKFRGPVKLAETQRATFIQFVKSLKW